MPLARIPRELCALPQWVCAHADKVPKDPKSGRVASVSDPNTWGTHDQAATYAQRHGAYVGFVLSAADPFTIIDLDDKVDRPATPVERDRHEKIIESFDSYTERSCSGRGYHIVLKGTVPAATKRETVEAYSAGHYFIFTGDVIRDRPIADRQSLLDQLVGEMSPAPTVALEHHDEVLDDRDLVDMAMNATNADKFNALCQRRWQDLGYPSQSEADFALLAILAFYSPSNEQVRRIFRYSMLGKREKATRDDKYLNRSLSKIRANEPPRIDRSALLANQTASAVGVPEVLPPPETPTTTSPAASNNADNLPPPPGMVGRIATYIRESAVYPNEEVALAGALTLIHGIIGRQFNIYTGAGSNDYFMLLGPTGVGKEAARDGTDAILKAVRQTVPAIYDFRGPSEIASGPALLRVLEKKPCIFCHLGEGGFTLHKMTSPRAGEHDIGKLKVVLELYSRSGRNKTFGESAYADTEKSFKVLDSPTVTILLDSTPGVLYDGVDPSHIAMGLLPRFNIIECRQDRSYFNEAAGFDPPKDIVEWVAGLGALCLEMRNSNSVALVPLDPPAKCLLDAFGAEADSAIRGSDEVHRQLWNRAHLHALKVATAIAVGVDPYSPIVREEPARWAIAFVRRCIEGVLRRFATGEVGAGAQSKAEVLVRKLIEKFITGRPDQRAKDDKIPTAMRTGPFVPHAYLREHTKRLQPFKGNEQALRNTLDAMVKDGVLRVLDRAEKIRRFPGNRGGEVYEVIT